MWKKAVHSLLILAFLAGTVLPPAGAQSISLPAAQGLVQLSAAYAPCLLRGVKLDAKDPFRFNFIVDKGDASLPGNDVEEESRRLIKYFLTTLTTPENDLWVNLSPYESERIITDNLGRTTMGRDLLAQDYLLKQITSSLIYPDGETGKAFWAEIYKKAYAAYGTTDIPIDTFNKVWIMPARAVVYETRHAAAEQGLGAYIEEASLKVMLESDYLAREKSQALEHLSATEKSTQDMAREVVRTIILPALEKEVNEGKNFAQLRQIYHSLLLAVWLKKKLHDAATGMVQDGKPQGHILSSIFVDRAKTSGLETQNPRNEITGIYDRYTEAFRKGAYNLIREDYDENSKELLPRKYFSGGFEGKDAVKAIEPRGANEFSGKMPANAVEVTVDLNEARAEPAAKRVTMLMPKALQITFVKNALGWIDARIGDDAPSGENNFLLSWNDGQGVAVNNFKGMGGNIYDQLFNVIISDPQTKKELLPLFFLFRDEWVYFFKEAVQNALDAIGKRDKTFSKGKVTINMSIEEGNNLKEFVISIEDNGTGLPANRPRSNNINKKGYRLFDNVTDLGKSASEQGATVEARVPLNETSSTLNQRKAALSKLSFNEKEALTRQFQEEFTRGSTKGTSERLGLGVAMSAININAIAGRLDNAAAISQEQITRLKNTPYTGSRKIVESPERWPMIVPKEYPKSAMSITDLGIASNKDPRTGVMNEYMVPASIGDALTQVNNALNNAGYSLVVTDGIRTLSEQKKRIADWITKQVAETYTYLSDNERALVAGTVINADLFLRRDLPTRRAFKEANADRRIQELVELLGPQLKAALPMIPLDDQTNFVKNACAWINRSFLQFADPDLTSPHLAGSIDVEVHDKTSGRALPTKADHITKEFSITNADGTETPDPRFIKAPEVLESSFANAIIDKETSGRIFSTLITKGWLRPVLVKKDEERKGRLNTSLDTIKAGLEGSVPNEALITVVEILQTAFIRETVALAKSGATWPIEDFLNKYSRASLDLGTDLDDLCIRTYQALHEVLQNRRFFISLMTLDTEHGGILPVGQTLSSNPNEFWHYDLMGRAAAVRTGETPAHDVFLEINILDTLWGNRNIPELFTLDEKVQKINPASAAVPQSTLDELYSSFSQETGFNPAYFYPGCEEDVKAYILKAFLLLGPSKKAIEKIRTNGENNSPLGGIDLTPDEINMMIRGNGGKMAFCFTPQQLEILERNISGFVPVIIRVQPATDVPMFLGLGEPALRTP